MTRELVPVSSATGPQSRWLIEQLPVVMGEDDFLRRFLGIFEEIFDSMRKRVDGFEHTIDLGVAPIEFVRWMGSWVGLRIEPTRDEDLDDEALRILGEHRQRDIVRRVGPLFAWRGTGLGLQRLLEAVTGADVRVIDSGGVFSEGMAPTGPKHVRVELSGAGDRTDEQVASLLRREIPADVTFELEIGGRVVPVAYPERPSPRLEQGPTPGEEALLAFTTGMREMLDDAAVPTDEDQSDGDDEGPSPGPGHEGEG